MRLSIFILFALCATISYSQFTNFQCLQKTTIESEALGDSRDIWVGLPVDYDSSKTYSTLYVLDAETRYDITYALSKEFYMNQAAISELIVVGIPQIDWVHRIKDMTFTDCKLDASGQTEPTGAFDESKTGGGMQLLKHLEEEVIPLVNQNYSTNGFNTLIGHSLGGYFCAYVMPIQHSFSAFLICDGSIWYNQGDVLKHLKKNLPKDFKSNVYITSGLAFDGPRDQVDPHIALIDSLRLFLSDYPNIDVGYSIYEDEDHVSMYMYSIMDGLSTVFKDCDYGFISPFEELSVQQYKDFYKAASERLGFEISPPVDGYRWVAYANHYQKKWEEALKAYDLCYHKFSEDIAVNAEIAECHKMLGNKKEQKFYEEKMAKLEEAAKR